jgi:hypothetical protein
MGIAATVSLLMHLCMPHYERAILVSVFISAAAFQILNYVKMGYVDPFFIIAFVMSSGHAAIISILVGLPFYLMRTKKS